jgi:hypothetical protein
LLCIDASRCRDGHSRQYAGDGGVDARFQEGEPEANAQQAVNQRAPHARPIGEDHEQQETAADSQPRPGDLGRIKQSDHQHRPKVIDDGQCRHEHAQ